MVCKGILLQQQGEYLYPEEKSPGMHALCTPGPLGKDKELPAAAPLAAAPVPAAIAIGTLLLRPGFIHDQGPPRKL